MKNRLFITFLLGITALTLFAQTNSIQKSMPLTDAQAESVAMSTERLQRIDAMLQKSVDQKEIPGAVAIVCRNGKIVYQKAFGSADNTAGRAMKTDDIFRIASMSKAVTATAVMMLWEEGKFQLDDPISKYIPEFGNAQVLDTLYENGTYEYYSETSSSGPVASSASQESDSGTWTATANTITRNSRSQGTATYSLEKRNHPKTGDPMLVLDGDTYVTYGQRRPW